LVFAILVGCGLSAVRRWLAGLLEERKPWLARPILAGLAAIVLLMPLYPLWQNWAEVDQSDHTYYRDLARDFVQHVEPNFVLVESEARYDDLEAILYVAWAEQGWYSAQTVTPGGIDPWLGKRPVYCWYGDVDVAARYVQEPFPELPGMARIVGVKED
jgi:hypothetical protein